jgi:[calcium/calmodulin-dependent protein kinase] kinase
MCSNNSNKKYGISTVDEIKNEIMVMEMLNHPHIIRLLEVIDDLSSKNVFMVLEHMENGPILPPEEIVNPLTCEVAWKYFRDILEAVIYLHEKVKVLLVDFLR